MQLSGPPVDPGATGGPDGPDVVDALAAGPIEDPPAGLRSRVLDAALHRRRAGRPPGFTTISPLEGYRRTVAELDRLLDQLAPDEWPAPVERYGWSVQGLLGHLLAVERALGALLAGDQPDIQPELAHDHIAMTEATVAAQDDRPPSHTLTDWREAARRVLDALSRGAGQGERVELYGITWPWDTLLVVRALEVWTHTDDIRRATGRPLAAPDAQRLGLMTELAVRTIPRRVTPGEPTSGEPMPGPAPEPTRWVRFVLTGSGGGAWTRPLGPAGPDGPAGPAGPAGAEAVAPDPPVVRIVADAASFCRLAAGRLTVAELGPRIDGDRALAERLLAQASAFAA